MYNFNEFCKSKKCNWYREYDMPVGKCISCKPFGVTFNITQWPHDCLHGNDIMVAKAEAMKKHIMWKTLNDVHEEIDITVYNNDITKRIF